MGKDRFKFFDFNLWLFRQLLFVIGFNEIGNQVAN
jgi:hypothetical protein